MKSRRPSAAIVVAILMTCVGCIEIDWIAGPKPINHGSLRLLLDLHEANEKGLIDYGTYKEQRDLLEKSLK